MRSATLLSLALPMVAAIPLDKRAGTHGPSFGKLKSGTWHGQDSSSPQPGHVVTPGQRGAPVQQGTTKGSQPPRWISHIPVNPPGSSNAAHWEESPQLSSPPGGTARPPTSNPPRPGALTGQAPPPLSSSAGGASTTKASLAKSLFGEEADDVKFESPSPVPGFELKESSLLDSGLVSTPVSTPTSEPAPGISHDEKSLEDDRDCPSDSEDTELPAPTSGDDESFPPPPTDSGALTPLSGGGSGDLIRKVRDTSNGFDGSGAGDMSNEVGNSGTGDGIPKEFK